MLRGKKRYIGIITLGLASILEELAVIPKGLGNLLQIAGGTIFGVGHVDAEKRKTEALKEVARKP